MRGIMSALLILIFVAIFFVGNTLYESDLESDIERDIYNFTNTLQWDYNESYIIEPYNVTLKNIGDVRKGRLSKVIYKFVDLIGFTSIEAAKTGIEFGYTHPQYDYPFYFQLAKYYLIMVIVALLVPIIVPFIALVYLLFIGLKKLWTWLCDKSDWLPKTNPKVKQTKQLDKGNKN